MSSDPRAALNAFVAALETHLELSAMRRGENDPAVITAYQKVADAFVAYDDALLDAFGEVTPLDIYSDDDEADDDVDELEDDLDEEETDDDELDDEDDDGEYLGLDDEEYDLEDDDTGGDDAEDDDTADDDTTDRG